MLAKATAGCVDYAAEQRKRRSVVEGGKAKMVLTARVRDLRLITPGPRD